MRICSNGEGSYHVTHMPHMPHIIYELYDHMTHESYDSYATPCCAPLPWLSLPCTQVLSDPATMYSGHVAAFSHHVRHLTTWHLFSKALLLLTKGPPMSTCASQVPTGTVLDVKVTELPVLPLSVPSSTPGTPSSSNPTNISSCSPTSSTRGYPGDIPAQPSCFQLQHERSR